MGHQNIDIHSEGMTKIADSNNGNASNGNNGSNGSLTPGGNNNNREMVPTEITQEVQEAITETTGNNTTNNGKPDKNQNTSQI